MRLMIGNSIKRINFNRRIYFFYLFELEIVVDNKINK